MIRIGSILAATDFSPDSRNGAIRAAMLARSLIADKGTLLHVAEKSWIDAIKELLGGSVEAEQGLMDEASRSLAGLIEDVSRVTGFTLEPLARMGNVLNEIIDAAAQGSDLLIVGARGRHRMRALALGSTAERLVSKIKKPMLVVKRRPEKRYIRVLVPVDFSPNSGRALACAPVIAPAAAVCVAHVIEPLFGPKMLHSGPSELVEKYRTKTLLQANVQMGRLVKAAGFQAGTVDSIIEHGELPGTLREIADKWKADLIIVGKHGRSQIEDFILGSITRHALAELSCDVLVVR